MVHLTDEMLMAYADSELDRAAQKQVEAALESNPALRDRLKMFTATGSLLAQLFDAPMRQAVPPHLLALVNGSKPSPVVYRSVRDPARPGLAETIRKIMFGGPSWTGALAWSVPVVLITAGIYWHIQTGAGEPNEFVIASQGQLFAQGAFDLALNSAHSGNTTPLGANSGASLSPVLTFRNHQQEFCRQYEITAPDSAHAGIACRREDGRWRLDIHNPVALRSRPGDHTMPAGKSASAVEAAVSGAMDGDALGAADEDALIRNGWRQ